MHAVISLKRLIPRRKWARYMVGSISCLCILLAVDMIWVRVWRNIPIGYSATRLTGPLRADGAVNYAAAIDRAYGAGVTPKNNAVPLLIKAIGTRPITEPGLRTFRRRLFLILGIKSPAHSSRLQSYSQWVVKQLGNSLANAQWDMDVAHVDNVFRSHPWTEKEFPMAARWVQACAKPLAILHRAVQRPRYYFPIVAMRDENMGNSYLEYFYVLAGAATAMAMFRLGQGNINAAITDIDDTQRLAALTSQSPSMLQRFSSFSIGYLGMGAEAAAAGTGKLSKSQLEVLRRNTLPKSAIWPMAKQINFERFIGLAFLYRAARQGPRTLLSEFNATNPNGPPKFPPLSDRLMDALVPVDFAACMQRKNTLYDLMVSAMGKPSYAQRKAAMAALIQRENQFAAHHPLLMKSSPMDRTLPEIAKNMAQVCGGNIEEALMKRKITLLAIALAIYMDDHSRYPRRLAALVPHYVPKIPLDGFSGKPLMYRVTDHGQSFLLYSVGPNGKDDGGKSYPHGDDIAVRGGAVTTRHNTLK
jgi:hypothetical protein